MSARSFDRTFGVDFLASVPRAPGVYVYRDRDGAVVYVGKAVDLRARLGQYRNASRRKAHRKMLRIVRESAALTFEVAASEQDALLRENALIQAHRPPLNVEGAFAFLYPSLGWRRDELGLHLAWTTLAEPLVERGFSVAGCFRNRLATRAGFDALVDVLERLGHRERAPERLAHTVWRTFRQVPPSFDAGIAALLGGTSRDVVGDLALALVERPGARNDARAVQASLRAVARFHDTEAIRLARLGAMLGVAYIAQDVRDRADILAGDVAGEG